MGHYPRERQIDDRIRFQGPCQHRAFSKGGTNDEQPIFAKKPISEDVIISHEVVIRRTRKRAGQTSD
jgi:hypothetical protein